MTRPHRRLAVQWSLAWWAFAAVSVAFGETPAANAPPTNAPVAGHPELDPSVKSTAVALNYCRTAFHRIRQNPSKAVLHQEQEKILNNLNLTSIPEPEVVALYTSVLDEINQVGLADYERKLLRDTYKQNVSRKMTWDAVAFGTDLATAQFGNAVRSGANSWWDYRTTTLQRDVDLLRVDKARMTTVVQKSSQFLDTFWKLAQKKQIPDRWLIRGDDLDALDAAVREPDPQVRLRVMRRMAGFMEAYPPYWYYLGRTQQELGQLAEAKATYEQLVELGDRHFRKDDMLATGLANKAAIQEFQNDPGSVETANRALAFSTDVWEANLICARVLQRHRRFAEAEDAVLRNLDVGLEHDQSRVFLVSVYYHAEERGKLARTLSDPHFANLPTPALIRCAALLGPEQTPPQILQQVAASIDAHPRIAFGPDEVVLRASDAWQLPLAQLKGRLNGRELSPAHASTVSGGHELRLAARGDLGNPLGQGTQEWDLSLDLTYPDATTVSLRLTLDPEPQRSPSTRMTAFRGPTAPPTLRLSTIEVGEKRLSFASVRSPDRGGTPRPVPAPSGASTYVPELLPIETDPSS
ncbi:MAG: hypothetical protein KF774_06240 [Planctomyces sp.]|nr:hypothetical protein [Planctomyces sp.]